MLLLNEELEELALKTREALEEKLALQEETEKAVGEKEE